MSCQDILNCFSTLGCACVHISCAHVFISCAHVCISCARMHISCVRMCISCGPVHKLCAFVCMHVHLCVHACVLKLCVCAHKLCACVCMCAHRLCTWANACQCMGVCFLLMDYMIFTVYWWMIQHLLFLVMYQHQNVVCDHCENEIFGPRYKCGYVNLFFHFLPLFFLIIRWGGGGGEKKWRLALTSIFA